MNWTDEQYKAIHERNKNILVAAAAGSGKTAVLVERIKQLVLEDRCPIDRMLIVTFTAKAAQEMKEKIRKALSRSIAGMSTENPSGGSYNTTDTGAADRNSSNESGASQNKKADMLFMKRQLDLLPLSNISTFHSFSLEVIRRYFYLINIEPDFKIADESQAAILREQAMDRLLDELFEKNEKPFYDFLNRFSGDRNENRFRDMIQSAYDTLMALPEPMTWLRDAVEELRLPLQETRAYSRLGEMVKTEYAEAVRLAGINCREAESRNYTEMLKLVLSDKEKVDSIQAAMESWNFNDIRSALLNAEFDRANASYFKADKNNADDAEELTAVSEAVKSRRSRAKDILKKIKERYFYDSLENLEAMVQGTYEDALLLESYIRRYEELYRQAKKEKGMLDFSDIEHYAFEILKNDEAASYYRSKFNHIFVDEYQDSNVIQEALINLIKRDNNLFLVGDVKQSIYKFRLAEPEIFQRRYAEYSRIMEESQNCVSNQNPERKPVSGGEYCSEDNKTHGDEPVSIKIDLNKNFRSKQPVIDFINSSFEPLMSGYDENARLYAGDPFAGKSEYKPEMFLVPTFWDNDAELDDELKNLQKAQKEALAAVKIISDILGKPFFDSKLAMDAAKQPANGSEINPVRPFTKRDIVILLRSVKNYGDIYYKILTENNLPTYVDDNEGYFDTIEINTFMALLAVIDNEKQDIPLITVMRSEAFEFEIDELAKIRILHKAGTYYDAVRALADSYEDDSESDLYRLDDKDSKDCGIADGRFCDSESEISKSDAGCTDIGLALKCRRMFDKLDEWQELRLNLSLEDFVWELMLDSGLYIRMGALPAGTQRQANMRTLVDKALSYRKSQGGSLYGFMKYIDAVKQKKVSMGQVKLVGEDDDTIRIMTIHKSKGLEFPVVLIGGYNRELNYSKMGRKAAIHKDIGIGLPVVNYKESWYQTTFLQNVIKSISIDEEVEEQKRVLYVAMTRARDVLYMLGVTDDIEKLLEKTGNDGLKTDSYFGMTGKTLMMQGTINEISNSSLIGFHREKQRKVSAIREMLDREPKPVSDEIKRLMEYSYPYEEETHIKSKYSVSELNSAAGDYEPMLKEPSSFKPKGKLNVAQIGTATHKVLEQMSFAEAASSADKGSAAGYFSSLMDHLVADEYLTEDEAKAVDTGKLEKFVSGELGRRIAEAEADGRLYREQNFNMKMQVSDYGTNSDIKIQASGHEAIVQGTIDCYFYDTDGRIVLIDYKTTKHTDIAKIKDTYSKQIAIYSQALEAATGAEVKEAYLYLTNSSRIIDMK